MRISDWSSDVCSSDLQEEARILARAVDRLREIGRELAADGRDVDADLFEHLPGHHAAYPAAPFAGLHSIGLAVPGRIGERGVAARLSLDRLKFGADAVAQRLEPVARSLLLGIQRDHAAKPFVCLKIGSANV